MWEKSPSLQAFQELLEKKEPLLLEGLWSSPKALLASLICKWTNRSVILVTEGVHTDSLLTDLAYFDPDLPIEFPAWETMPAEEIAPSKDILGKRFQALHTLSHKKKPVVLIVSLHSLLQKIPSQKNLSFLFFEKDQKRSFETLPKQLTELGYVRESLVSDKGQFAVRGGIIDLFPISETDPYRIEFFEDQIESIRTFDPVGQKSIQKTASFRLTPADERSLLNQGDLQMISDFVKDPLFFGKIL